jgi:hypothetical protein
VEAPPAAELEAAALASCEERCAELERGWAEAADERDKPDGWPDAELAALLPADGEWAAARAALAPPPHRARLFHAACAAPVCCRVSAAALPRASGAGVAETSFHLPRGVRG